MIGIVLSDNLFSIYMFWELVGLSSYLLIGFYFYKDSAADAQKNLPFGTTQVVLLDLRLGQPGGDGAELLLKLKSKDPKLRVLTYTRYADRDLVIAAVRAGADGYCLKRNGRAYRRWSTI